LGGREDVGVWGVCPVVSGLMCMSFARGSRARTHACTHTTRTHKRTRGCRIPVVGAVFRLISGMIALTPAQVRRFLYWRERAREESKSERVTKRDSERESKSERQKARARASKAERD
jgi:hypothetical protein